ncbi:MAG TPA: glycosyl hydrolase family 28 protein [Sedimentisphaerales bacterium]|nr:glycosyl hydrolase family 28 protein [Sedimentisphaerales bacterium]
MYAVKVAPGAPALRWKAMDDKVNSAQYFEKASFGYFDMRGPVAVSVTYPEPITSAKVLPSSLKIIPVIDGRRLSFSLAAPKPVTVEVNGNWVGALHLFANPPEEQAPRPKDPNVIYFGPGVHEVNEVRVGSGKTVYVAAGAVVKGTGDRRGPVFALQGDNITVRGRGIIDGSLCPTHSRNLMTVRGKDITIEGVIFKDSSVWTIPVRRSDRVTIRNVKLLAYRANSDGVDICNSRDVTVEDCFIRTLDDLIIVKADKDQGESRRIVARNCVLWNEVAHALSVGAEIRDNIDDVRFENCDVIHDKGREWTLRVFHCDAARVSNVRFENIRIEESPRLISLWIGSFVWTRDPERSHIDGVTFKDIVATAETPRIELTGFDETHAVSDVVFQDTRVNGKPLTPADVKSNAFVRGVRVTP